MTAHRDSPVSLDKAEARWIETAQFDILAATVRCIHSPPLADVLRTIDRADVLAPVAGVRD